MHERGCLGRCAACGKVTWALRRDARRHARRRFRGEHMNVYACPEGVGWHVGHLAPIVVAGYLTRSQRYDATKPSRRAADA